MGNETSSKHFKFDEHTVQEYTRKYREMEDTISTHNLTIKTLLTEKEKLEEVSAKKDEDTKRRVSDIKNQQKKVNSELSKYKSIPEFEDILSLYTELLKFRDDVDKSLTRVDQNQPNEDEIEQLKKKNLELSRQLKNAGGSSTLHEKAGELRTAEIELNAKRDQLRLGASKIKINLMLIQDKMTQCTAKFAANMSNAIVDAKAELRIAKREFSEFENLKKSDDNTSHYKVKNILLQQQADLMREVVLLTAGPSKPQQIQNNLRPTFSNLTVKDDNLSKYDSDEDNLINFDDDVSECGSSVSTDNLKPFKLVMHNIPDCGNDKLFVIEVLKNLTDLPLDDIVVRRIGFGADRPILVCFDKMAYIHQILKRKHIIKDGAFSRVRISTFRPNNKGKPDRRDDGGFVKVNNPKQKQTENKQHQNKNFAKKPNNNDAKKYQPKQDNMKSVFPF